MDKLITMPLVLNTEDIYYKWLKDLSIKNNTCVSYEMLKIIYKHIKEAVNGNNECK